eukprot:TRINITY_DN81_c0_g1_i2.p1 TRINITY_DN81_c0_g1~~TRINITY_DN81_c0_g1_i2.p1  ORF type:complete len:909 (+),score=244.88 TRINITY_DN81_c0_g1_i2:94-2820(+)
MEESEGTDVETLKSIQAFLTAKGIELLSCCEVVRLKGRASKSVQVHHLVITKRVKHGSDRVEVYRLLPEGHGIFHIHSKWRLEMLRKIDGADEHGNAFIIHFEREKARRFAAASGMEKNRFIWELYQTCRSYTKRQPELVNINLVELSVLVEKIYAHMRGRQSVLLPSLESAKKITHRDLVSEEEERDLEGLLTEFPDVDLMDAAKLHRTLAEDLHELEKGIVHELLASEIEMRGLHFTMLDLTKEVETARTSIVKYTQELETLREDFRKIETLNNRMEMRTKNHQKLTEYLSKFVESFSLPEDMIEVLKHPSFGSREELSNVIRALNALDDALQTPQADDMKNLEAYRERKEFFSSIRMDVARKVGIYLSNLFGRLTTALMGESSRFSARGNLVLSTHQLVYDTVLPFSPLIRCMKYATSTSYSQLLVAYNDAIAPVYRREHHSFFAEVRPRIIRDSREAQSFASDTQSMHSARSSGRFRAGSGGSLASMSTVRQGHIDADLTVDEAFSKVLDFVLKCCEEEHDFLTHTFDLKPSETIDMSSENSLQKSMSTLFSHLKMEMQSFFKWIDRRANRYYFLTMMADVEDRLALFQGKNMFVSVMLTDIQIELKKLFNSFLAVNLKAVKEYRGTARRAGILPFVSKLPGFVEYVDSMMGSRGCEVANQPLLKTMVAVTEKIDKMSIEDPKYAHVLKMENYHFISRALTRFAERFPVLQKFVDKAKNGVAKHLLVYSSELIRRSSFKEVLTFFDGIDECLKRIPPKEVAFQSDYSKSRLRAITKHNPMSSVRKGMIETLKRMDKHLCVSENLMSMVWTSVKQVTISVFEHIESLIRSCYPSEELAYTKEKIEELLSDLETNIDTLHLKKPIIMSAESVDAPVFDLDVKGFDSHAPSWGGGSFLAPSDDGSKR